jgi:hypothetical protein
MSAWIEMAEVSHSISDKEAAEIQELLSNEFAAGVIKGIREFKSGQGAVYKDKNDFLNSLKAI